jgi:hypothetical protein
MLIGSAVVRRGPVYYKSLERELELKKQERTLAQLRVVENERQACYRNAISEQKKHSTIEKLKKMHAGTRTIPTSFRREKTGSTPTMRFICEATAAYSDIDVERLIGKTREIKIVVPRQIAAYLCYRYTMKSTSEVGKALGDRDHTTILHAVRKIERMVKAGEPAINAAISEIRMAVSDGYTPELHFWGS